jgi:hypothetical protein
MNEFVSESDFRDPSTLEVELIRSMLRPDFPGRDVLLRQLEGATVRRVDADGSLKILVRSLERAQVPQMKPVIGFSQDLDGMLIEFMLYVIDGRLEEFEILRADSKPLQHVVQPDELEVSVAPPWPDPK